MKVSNKVVVGSIIISTISALVACLQDPSNLSQSTSTPQLGKEEFNNSDPSKTNYAHLQYTPGYNKQSLENQSREINGSRRIEASPLYGQAAPKTTAAVKYHGVIPKDRDCDDPAARAWIYQDDEDSNNRSRISWSASYYIPWGINDGNAGNTRFRFCKVDGNQFTRLHRYPGKPEGASDYAVLTFGDNNCPNGGFSFSKQVRNQCPNNNNSNSGNIALSNQDFQCYTDYYMCFYPDLPSNGANEVFPPSSSIGGIGIQYYYVFANPNVSGPFWNNDKGYVYSDDEDNVNGNNLVFFDLPNAVWTENFRNRLKTILPHSSNSYFNLYRASPVP
jgi:hypothetical protein